MERSFHLCFAKAFWGGFNVLSFRSQMAAGFCLPEMLQGFCAVLARIYLLEMMIHTYIPAYAYIWLLFFYLNTASLFWIRHVFWLYFMEYILLQKMVMIRCSPITFGYEYDNCNWCDSQGFFNYLLVDECFVVQLISAVCGDYISLSN